MGLLQWWEASWPGFALSSLLCCVQGWVSSSPFRPSSARVRIWNGKAFFPGLPEVPCTPNLSGQGGACNLGAMGSRKGAWNIVLETKNDSGIQEEAGPLGEEFA